MSHFLGIKSQKPVNQQKSLQIWSDYQTYLVKITITTQVSCPEGNISACKIAAALENLNFVKKVQSFMYEREYHVECASVHWCFFQ